MRTLTRGTYSVRYKGSLLYYAIAFRFNTKRFLVSGVNIALNVTVAKSLMRKNLIQRRTRSFDLSISLLVTFSSFLFVVVVVPCFL